MSSTCRQAPRRRPVRRPDPDRVRARSSRAPPLQRRGAHDRPLGTRRRSEKSSTTWPTASSRRRSCERFAAYDKARTRRCCRTPGPCLEPLVVAADAEAREPPARRRRSPTRELTDGLRDHYDALFERLAPTSTSSRARSCCSTSDPHRGRQQVFALLSPAHPLFLWHYAHYAEVVEAQRDRLPRRDRDAGRRAARAAAELPDLDLRPRDGAGQGRLPHLRPAGSVRCRTTPRRSRRTPPTTASMPSPTLVRALHRALEPHARLGLPTGADRSAGGRRLPPRDRRPQRRGVLAGAHVVVYRQASDRRLGAAPR